MHWRLSGERFLQDTSLLQIVNAPFDDVPRYGGLIPPTIASAARELRETGMHLRIERQLELLRLDARVFAGATGAALGRPSWFLGHWIFLN
jgi:hypothetical protein